MPTVEKTSGGRVYLQALDQRFEIGDRADVSEGFAAYLCEERGDFECVAGNELESAEVNPEDVADELAVDSTADDPAICGYEADDGSVCQRSAGWGRDADSGPCKDHADAEEAED